VKRRLYEEMGLTFFFVNDTMSYSLDFILFVVRFFFSNDHNTTFHQRKLFLELHVFTAKVDNT
jgi:hypothetical protein